MLFRQSPDKFWNLIARFYAASPIADKNTYKAKIEKIRSYLSPDSLVLDIGCGTGTQCGDLAGNVKHVTGIDISSKLLAIAEQRKTERGLDNIDFIHTGLFDGSLEAKSFDMVMAFYVFHFIEDIDAAFAYIHKLLKPGGMFISETACLGNSNRTTRTLLGLAGSLGIVPQINLLTTERLEKSLSQNDFRLVDKIQFSPGNVEYTLFAKRS